MPTSLRSRPSLLALAAIILVACGGPTPDATGSADPFRPTPIGTPPPVGTTASSTAPTPAPTAAATATIPAGSDAPSPTLPAIGIIGVECLVGRTVRLHVSITAEAGIPPYALWSTWGGGGDTTRSFPAPYTTQIDEFVEFTHAIDDPVPDRIHEFGLAVTLVGVPDPIITYAIEPGNRCPGH